MRKFSSRFKYYSHIIFPIVVLLICHLANNKSHIFEINNEKSSILVSISSSFIGVLVTVLTIYLAVPKNETKLRQLKESYHEHIYLMNILAGLILLFASIVSWLFFNNTYMSSITFVAAMSNIIISIYYTFTLIKVMYN